MGTVYGSLLLDDFSPKPELEGRSFLFLLLFLNESLYQKRAKMREKKVIFSFSIENLIGNKKAFFHSAQYGRDFLFQFQ